MHAALPQPAATAPTGAVFSRLLEIVTASGLPHALHAHQATRTMADAAQHLSFDLTRLVKTVAFRTRAGALALAALRGTRRVDYARLAALLGVNRRDLAALSPPEVLAELGVLPGSVSPLGCLLGRSDVDGVTLPVAGEEALPGSAGHARLLVDEDVLEIRPSLYCGIGRPDRTLEISAQDLLLLVQHDIRVCTGVFSR